MEQSLLLRPLKGYILATKKKLIGRLSDVWHLNGNFSKENDGQCNDNDEKETIKNRMCKRLLYTRNKLEFFFFSQVVKIYKRTSE